MQQQHEAHDDAAGNDGTAGTSRESSAIAVAAAVGQQQQQQQNEPADSAEGPGQQDPAGDSAAGGDVRGAAAGLASRDTAAGEQEQYAAGILFEGEPQDADASQQQLFATLLKLSCCTAVLPLGCLSMLGAERMQRMSLALAAAAGEAGALQLWEPFIAVAQPFVAEGMQLAKEMQLQLQACGAVGLQKLSEDAEACSAAMQLLQPMRQLGTAVAQMQSGSMAVLSGSGPQFSAAALSSRMFADCSEMHAALANHTAELLQLNTAVMLLPEEAHARVQAGAWQQLEAAAERCLLVLRGLADAMPSIDEQLKPVRCLTAAAAGRDHPQVFHDMHSYVHIVCTTGWLKCSQQSVFGDLPMKTVQLTENSVVT
jgi:uncharacterized Zn-finger protein